MCVYLYYLAGRYFVTSSTGDLYIRSVKADDNLKKFACQTTNRITRERKISEPVHLSIKGRHFIQYPYSKLPSSLPLSIPCASFNRQTGIISSLTNGILCTIRFSEVTTNMAPTTNQKPVLNMYVDHGNDIHLPCNIQGNPLPFYAYVHFNNIVLFLQIIFSCLSSYLSKKIFRKLFPLQTIVMYTKQNYT